MTMTSASGDEAGIEPVWTHCDPLSLSEQDAWALFFENNYASLVKACLLSGHSMEDAEDGANTAMLEIRQRWTTITNREAYARRVAINHARELRAHRNGEASRLVEKGVHLVYESTQDQLGAHESREWVSQLLDCLSPLQRAVMGCIYDGLTAADIAELLDKTPENVRKNLELARKRLKQKLNQQNSRGNVARPDWPTGKEQR